MVNEYAYFDNRLSSQKVSNMLTRDSAYSDTRGQKSRIQLYYDNKPNNRLIR